jgi:hypothetical protein
MRKVSRDNFWTKVKSHHDQGIVEWIEGVMQEIDNLYSPSANATPKDFEIALDEARQFIKTRFMPAMQMAIEINDCSCPEDVARVYAAMLGFAEVIILTGSDDELDDKLENYASSFASQRRCHATSTRTEELVCYCDEHKH